MDVDDPPKIGQMVRIRYKTRLVDGIVMDWKGRRGEKALKVKVAIISPFIKPVRVWRSPKDVELQRRF